MLSPMPTPSTNMYTDSRAAPESGSIRDIRNSPTPITAEPATGNHRYLPVLLTTLPLKTEAISSPRTMGSVRTPEIVAESPSTYCRYVGRYVIEPSIAKPTTKLSTVQTANTGFLNSRIGSIGWAARVSAQPNSASATPAGEQ